MKKIGLIAIVVLFALCSCKKVNLTEQLPQIKGEWQWKSSVVADFPGVVNVNTDENNLVLCFDEDNTIVLKYNGEIVESTTYSCKKNDKGFMGNDLFVISLPKKVKDNINKLVIGDYLPILDGYIAVSLSTAPTDNAMITIWDRDTPPYDATMQIKSSSYERIDKE